MAILTADIVSGVRPAGEMLPKEVDLAAEFAVSRGVARETIRAMEERGLISVRHGRGATVNDPREWDVLDADVLAVMLDSERGSDVLAEYVECRRILEVEAAGMAAERATKAQIARLAAAFERMEDSAQRLASHATEERFHEADVAFHHALLAAAGNRALAGLAERIQSALLIARLQLARPQYRQERALPEHKRILAAVKAGDRAEARQAMSDHLDTIAGYLIERRQGQRPRGRRVRAGG
jgi:DNA-binding FadR family transcriptional regulator